MVPTAVIVFSPTSNIQVTQVLMALLLTLRYTSVSGKINRISSPHPIPRTLAIPKVLGVSLHLPPQPEVLHIWAGQYHSCLTRLFVEIKPKEAWKRSLTLKWRYMINVMKAGKEPLLQSSKPSSLKARQFSFKFIATEIITVGLWSNHNAKHLINHTESL